MAKIAKVINTRWETIDGVLCAVLVTRDKVRGERSFAVRLAHSCLCPVKRDAELPPLMQKVRAFPCHLLGIM